MDYIRKLFRFVTRIKKITVENNKHLISKNRAFLDSLRFMSFLINMADQFLYIKKALKKKNYIQRYDVVISTYGPISSHFIARKLKMRQPHILWIADFRDPVYQTNVPKSFASFMKNHPNKVCSTADIITIVNKNFLSQLFLNENNNNKICYLPNGFDAEDLELAKIRLPFKTNSKKID